MKHLPYEEWLLDQTTQAGLTDEERHALHAHLEDCAACSNLARAWREVDLELRRVSPVNPLPGFTLRWQARLERQRRRQHRRQSLAMLSFSIVGASFLLASLVLLAWPYLQTPSSTLWEMAYYLFSLTVLMGELGELLQLTFSSLGGSIPWVGWIFMVGVLCELCVLWFVSFRVLTQPRRITP